MIALGVTSKRFASGPDAWSHVSRSAAVIADLRHELDECRAERDKPQRKRDERTTLSSTTAWTVRLCREAVGLLTGLSGTDGLYDIADMQRFLSRRSCDRRAPHVRLRCAGHDLRRERAWRPRPASGVITPSALWSSPRKNVRCCDAAHTSRAALDGNLWSPTGQPAPAARAGGNMVSHFQEIVSSIPCERLAAMASRTGAQRRSGKRGWRRTFGDLARRRRG
jgi:hypothetical protein